MSEKSDAREARAEAKEQARVEAAEAVKAESAEAAAATKPTDDPFAIPQLRDDANPKDWPNPPVNPAGPVVTKPARQTIIPGLYEKISDHSFVHVSVVDGGDEVMLRDASGSREGLGRLSAEDFLRPGVYARVID